MKIIKISLITIILIQMCFKVIAQPQSSKDNSTQTLSFHEYLSKVGKNNLAYIAEKYNLDIAVAEIIAQKILPDPNLVIEGEYEKLKLKLEYDLELGNKRGARVRLAKSQAEVEKLALEYYYQELRADAANLFLDVIKQRELLDLNKRSYGYMYQLSKSDSIRFRLGEITEMDARQSKLEAATLLNDVFEQEATYKAALVSLDQFMGRLSDTLSIPLGQWDKLDREYFISDLLSAGLTNRIDLFIANKNVEVSTNRQILAKAERKINLGLSLGYERDWHGFLPSSKSLVAGISIPLKFSNLNKGEIKAAQLAIDQSKTQQQNTELEIQTEITQAFYYFEAAKKKVKHYETGLLNDSQKILQGAVYKYKRGETNITEVLIAQRTFNEVQKQYLDTMKEYALALVNLQKSCGIWDIEF